MGAVWTCRVCKTKRTTRRGCPTCSVMLPPGPSGSLEAAQAWLRERLGAGAHCPCCGQFSKIYAERPRAGASRAMVTMYNYVRLDWIHVPSTEQLGREGGAIARMRYWGLLEESTEKRADGGNAGWWRVTPKGLAWMRGEITVPKFAILYNARCYGLYGPATSFEDAIDAPFDLAELMATRVPLL